MGEDPGQKGAARDAHIDWRTCSPLKLWELVRQGEFSDDEVDELAETALQELLYDVAEVFFASSALRKRDFSFILRLSGIYESLGDFKRAIRILRYGVEQKVPNSEIYLQLGRFHERLKEYDKSLEVYRKAADLFPEVVDDQEYVDGLERAKRKIDIKGRVSSRVLESAVQEDSTDRKKEPEVPVLGVEGLEESGGQDSAEATLRKWMEALKAKNLAAYLECYHPATRLLKENTFEDLVRIYSKARGLTLKEEGSDDGELRTRKVSWLVADMAIDKWLLYRTEKGIWFLEFMEHLSETDLNGL